MTHLPVKLVPYSVVFGPVDCSHCFLHSCFSIHEITEKHFARIAETIQSVNLKRKRKKIAQHELADDRRLNRFLFQKYWWSGDCLWFSRFHRSHCPLLHLQPQRAWCSHGRHDFNPNIISSFLDIWVVFSTQICSSYIQVRIFLISFSFSIPTSNDSNSHSNSDENSALGLMLWKCHAETWESCVKSVRTLPGDNNAKRLISSLSFLDSRTEFITFGTVIKLNEHQSSRFISSNTTYPFLWDRL